MDLDDVLAETARMFLGLLERDFGRRIEFEAIVSYDLGRSLDLSRDELNEFMVTAHRSEALLSIAPMEGAIDTLDRWASEGYSIEIVTGRPTVTERDSREWLDAAGVPHDSLTFVDKYSWKESVFAGDPALPMHELAKTEYCLAVEDSASVASRLATIMDTPVVLIDKPWNREEENQDGQQLGSVTRCMDWEDISERFRLP